MINKIFTLLFISYLFIPCIKADNKDQNVTASALWQPGMESLHQIVKQCGSISSNVNECLVEEMKKNRASSEAIEFTKLIDRQGFMRDFKQIGPVDVAYVYYPFRANENQLCYLVNGTPKLINVDDFSNLPKKDMENNQTYKKLNMKYPKINLWPGNRYGTQYPEIIKTHGDGKRFIVEYKLKEGCHACRLLGQVKYAFEFDSVGKFIGARFLKITETDHKSSHR